MHSADLDNPIWASLASLHAEYAQRAGEVARYAADVAPFLGVPEDGIDVEAALEALVPEGDTVLVLGRAPAVSARWRLQHIAMLAQMVCEAPLAEIDGPEIIPLGEPHRSDVLALTALVYPHYFRAHTMRLGRYFGIYEDGRLAAMIGERLGTHHAREMSAICTHPDFLGRGYARRLTAMLSNDVLRGGGLPFLHVSHDNARAKALYLGMGYRHRRDLPFWSLRRAEPAQNA